MKFILGLFICALIPLIAVGMQRPVALSCLRCLCRSLTYCDNSRGCANGDCGIFAITKLYWMDGGSPTSTSALHVPNAYESCAMDFNCAATAVQNYMVRYQRDCNNDGVIDCWDFAAIHMHGPDSCGKPLAQYFARTLGQCLSPPSPTAKQFSHRDNKSPVAWKWD